MTDTGTATPLSLEMRRRIDASPSRLFAAWTTPAQLMRWWGPKGVTCTAAEIDLRVGGRYRIANSFPDGKIIWISGAFERIVPPTLLVYTWQIDVSPDVTERVTVSFQPQGRGTEVTVLHERIPDPKAYDGHERGWSGCLERLAEYLR